MMAVHSILLVLSCFALANAFKYEPKVSNLRFYIHTKLSQPHETVEVVAGPPGFMFGAQFGTVSVGDMLLTQDQSNTSKVVGRLKALVLNADSGPEFPHAHDIVMAVIETDKYNGTLAINGRDVASGFELAIIGGTGDFRGVKGWANFTHVEYIAPDSVTHVNATMLHPPSHFFN